jgi:DNA-binding winged helix-turn-helix (wHTH) protein
MVIVNVEKHEVYKGERRQLVHLAPREFLMLKLLAENRGKVLTREFFITTVYGVGTGDLDIVHPRTVDQHITRIRRKLGEFKDCVQTVTNTGYKGVNLSIENWKQPEGRIVNIERQFGKEACAYVMLKVKGVVPDFEMGQIKRLV